MKGNKMENYIETTTRIEVGCCEGDAIVIENHGNCSVRMILKSGSDMLSIWGEPEDFISALKSALFVLERERPKKKATKKKVTKKKATKKKADVGI